MAKMTISDIKSFAAAYVTSAQQAGAWRATTDNVVGFLDKIAKQITVDGAWNDRLPELNGEDLEFGKTIEEYFVDLTLPEAFNASGTGLGDHTPSFEAVTYSYTLGRKVIPTTIKYDNIERGCLNAEVFGNVVAKIMERLTNSETLYRYQQKKQLLGNFAAKAIKAGLVQTLAKPISDVTGEAFLKQVKMDIESASFANEGHNLGNYLIGAAPSLTLFIKKGVMPSIEVDTLAGAFNEGKLAIPANKIVIVDDFGADTVDVKAGDGVSPHVADNVDMSQVYAILMDPRGVKLHSGYRAVRSQENAEADRISYFLHTENTGYCSKSTFVKVYKAS